jgi:AraC-like DNA-binding protein
MRQGHHAAAIAAIEAARDIARTATSAATLLEARIDAWSAELACFQGRYSDAASTIERAARTLEAEGDLAYLAFAMRIRIAILLARADYEAIDQLSARAVAIARRSGDAYALVQILNILGAACFDRATSKLAVPHARAHLASLDPADTGPMEADAREALRHFEQARSAAEQAGYTFAAWYVSGNIERLHILLGQPQRAVRAIRKRLAVLQEHGATYDEIVTRSNLAWALRCTGRHCEALHELDVALDLSRSTGTFNVLLEFLYYDRSVVLDALGDLAAARTSYRRYLRLASTRSRAAPPAPTAQRDRPLEPYFLKRADRFIAARLDGDFGMDELARHCGVSGRTLQKAFADYRGVTPVAYVRNVRLDRAHAELQADGARVADVAARYGFGSTTTFTLEYRKRFGAAPRHRLRRSKGPE